MVNYPPAALDRTFAALADPTRRALLARLDAAPALTVSELARPLPMSLPAVLKHLAVLADAGLIERRKNGRSVTCQLRAAPLREAMDWLAHYERYWTAQLDRLACFLEEEQWPRPTSPPPASPSAAASRPRPRKSSRPGPGRKK